MEAERRTLYRHGALVLLLSVLLGIVAATPVPHASKWLSAHVSGLLFGLLTIGLGVTWPELRLAPATRRRAMLLGLTAAWTGFVGPVYAALVNLPGPVSDPGRTPDAPWHAPVFFVLLAVIVPTTIGAIFLVWKGLTGK
jgi:hypothetical protein